MVAYGYSSGHRAKLPSQGAGREARWKKRVAALQGARKLVVCTHRIPGSALHRSRSSRLLRLAPFGCEVIARSIGSSDIGDAIAHPVEQEYRRYAVDAQSGMGQPVCRTGIRCYRASETWEKILSVYLHRKRERPRPRSVHPSPVASPLARRTSRSTVDRCVRTTALGRTDPPCSERGSVSGARSTGPRFPPQRPYPDSNRP